MSKRVLDKISIIAFTGTVGSGKSTQMKILASNLKRKGTKVKLSFLKTGHIIAYFLTIILAKMLIGKRDDVSPIRALIEEKPHICRRVFKLWLGLDIISISLKFLFGIYLPLKLGYTILVEEYIPATISNHLYLSKVTGFTLRPSSFATTFLQKLMYLGPAQIIFLDAEDIELKHRWIRRKSFIERDDYLKFQRTILLLISKRLSLNKLLYINTSRQSVKETNQQIMKQLIESNSG
ncbi:hypothetical protein KEJ28_04675 [Candidatus Bathyarchaeota archaeon]|nr:hypothetical protein [Candidatus Bathyarchaeota archaeon]